MTDAEQIIWQALRNRHLLGFKFRRQWTLGFYVVDFFCCETRLVVEIDGGQHTAVADGARTAWLEAQGCRVLRFWNSDVMKNLEGVLQVIAQALENHPHPNPLPRAGEGV
ncbi:MAG TPA: endonuclease domain-containing protein [Allosphingosinicella sp.]